MDTHSSLEYGKNDSSIKKQHRKSGNVAVIESGASIGERSEEGRSTLIPMRLKLVSILLVTAIGFGSRWSSGVTGAMKSTLKKVSRHVVSKAPENF